VELNIEQPNQLVKYLRAVKRIESQEVPRIRVLSTTSSQRMMLVERHSGDAWVIKQAREDGQVPSSAATVAPSTPSTPSVPSEPTTASVQSNPMRIQREVLALRWLSKFAPPGSITPIAFEDPSSHLFAMKAIPQPNDNWQTMLLAGKLDLTHVAQFATMLGRIQNRAHLQKTEAEAAFPDTSFFKALKQTPWYAYTATQVPGAMHFLNMLIAEMQFMRSTLVHGDYRPQNILIYGGKLALLDHDLVHYGDCGFDVGYALAHFLSQAHQVPQYRPAFMYAARYFWTTFLEELGTELYTTKLESRAIKHTLASLLACAASKEPLEFLSEAQREKQKLIVMHLIGKQTQSVLALLDAFNQGLA
jgi:hypothetical protein